LELGLPSQRFDSNGRTIFVADAHRDDDQRFVARADEKLTAFLQRNRRFGLAARLRLTSRRDFFSKLGGANRMAAHRKLDRRRD
jgi:hypothetical protein